MLFSRFASCVAFVLTLGILAVAEPVKFDRRASAATVETVVTTLKSKTDTIIPQIKSAGANKQVSIATVSPLITELVAALNSAKGSIDEVQLGELDKRQTEETVTTTFSGIVSDIALGLGSLPPGLPGLSGLLVPVDVALSELIAGLNTVLVGVGLLVGGLLGTVAGLLLSLGLGLTLGLLGL